MRKLILEEWISLDGFVADKNGGLDFFTQLTPEENKYSDIDQLKFLDRIDTVLLGRKTSELFAEFWPNASTETEIIADKLNQTHKIVFSNTLKSAPWGKWADVEIVSGEAVDAVKKMKMLPGKDMVIWGSISLAQDLIKANLVDEYHLQLCPSILGGGRPLFTKGLSAGKLQLADTRTYDTGTVFLHYNVLK